MNSLDALLDWYSQLSPTSLLQIGQFYTPDARFKDPFNDVTGIAAIQQIFEHMFSHTDGPRFVIIDQLANTEQAFVTWDFHCGVRGRQLCLRGASQLRFAADGRIVLHRDYWDPTEELWQQLPLLGGPVRWLRRRFSAS